ncbi:MULTISPECIES: HD-GYP domain-containing protein [Bacillus]|uniref:HD-GYP domain-containing protein (C-di-GMP phosphodiesterase class II) n=1 Tax=Bacillus capparidis TaxID=1840411 RepID=A0ABS4CY56_9BACI|nr:MULTISPECIES: HD domain-containing phosphohydrolase [Bacillus]MBP1082298.1 HD-GYP domain-containing protein (c-di-GMP phosphodiesterase class II) [Bacillus capparidis]MED1096902.1 HD domain-containing phosphohydrolase [Bacillus capparidis]
MALLGAITAAKMQMDRGDIVQIALAGYLSDCGISQLSHGDRKVDALYKKHPALSCKMLENASVISQKAKVAILQHHELINGSGYPLSIKGDQIHLFGKILSGSRAVIDFFIEKNKRNDSNWLMSFENFTRQHLIFYDEAVMKRITIFIMNSLKHSTIVLSNGKIGEIVFHENDSLSRPLISVNEEIISLS